MELGKQIKTYRQEAHMSQEELAYRVYVSRQTISNWENDKSYPDVKSLILSESFNSCCKCCYYLCCLYINWIDYECFWKIMREE